MIRSMAKSTKSFGNYHFKNSCCSRKQNVYMCESLDDATYLDLPTAARQRFGINMYIFRIHFFSLQPNAESKVCTVFFFFYFSFFFSFSCFSFSELAKPMQQKKNNKTAHDPCRVCALGSRFAIQSIGGKRSNRRRSQSFSIRLTLT